MIEQRKYTQRLIGSRVLIVGGSAGIGYSVAEAALEHGAAVIISSSSEARVADAMSSLQKAYPSSAHLISGHACDLSTEATLDANVTTLLQQTGMVDHIVYTAGDALMLKPLRDITFADYKRGGMVRFFAPFLLCKAAFSGGHIRPDVASSITLTSGSISQKPFEEWSIYAGYLTGLHGMARNLALEMKPVRVNSITPGLVDTGLWGYMEEGEKKELFAKIREKLPTGRVGGAEDVAHTYIYMMLDRNCTGTAISTDGGLLLT